MDWKPLNNSELENLQLGLLRYVVQFRRVADSPPSAWQTTAAFDMYSSADRYIHRYKTVKHVYEFRVIDRHPRAKDRLSNASS